MKAMWMMVQQDMPQDYVIATAETHSVRDFIEIAFDHVGLNWKDYVKVDAEFYRPAEIFELCGDFAKARTTLAWEPTIHFEELVRMMIDFDLERINGQSKIADEKRSNIQQVKEIAQNEAPEWAFDEHGKLPSHPDDDAVQDYPFEELSRKRR